jgi:hypothetical protein
MNTKGVTECWMRAVIGSEAVDPSVKAEDQEFFWPNPLFICPYLLQAYSITLESREKNKGLMESLLG